MLQLKIKTKAGGKKNMQKQQKNIIMKGAKWASTLEMEANYYNYSNPSFYVRIIHIELGKEKASYNFEHLSSQKKGFQVNVNNILKDILDFYEGKGIKLSVSKLRKIILSLEELKETDK